MKTPSVPVSGEPVQGDPPPRLDEEELTRLGVVATGGTIEITEHGKLTGQVRYQPVTVTAFDLARLVGEVRRLRALVRRVVVDDTAPLDLGRIHPAPTGFCLWCGAAVERSPAPEPHGTGCPWPELEREASA